MQLTRIGIYRASRKDGSATEAAKSIAAEQKDAVKQGAVNVEGNVKEVVS